MLISTQAALIQILVSLFLVALVAVLGIACAMIPVVYRRRLQLRERLDDARTTSANTAIHNSIPLNNNQFYNV